MTAARGPGQALPRNDIEHNHDNPQGGQPMTSNQALPAQASPPACRRLPGRRKTARLAAALLAGATAALLATAMPAMASPISGDGATDGNVTASSTVEHWGSLSGGPIPI